ncbi:MAG: hypothetical protein ABIH63_02070 [archaeon]
MKPLEDLARDLGKVKATNDADLFYGLMCDLLENANFYFYYDVMGIAFEKSPDLFDDVYDAYNKENVEALASFAEQINRPVKAFVRVQKFIKNEDFFELFTSYENAAGFKKGLYDNYIIRSSSKLSFPKHVFDFDDVPKVYKDLPKGNLLENLLNICGVVKKGDLYYFSPQGIFDSVSSLPGVYCFGVEVKE